MPGREPAHSSSPGGDRAYQTDAGICTLAVSAARSANSGPANLTCDLPVGKDTMRYVVSQQHLSSALR